MTESSLDRTLGFTEAMTLGGGTMIGAGIFILPGIAAEGAGPASAVSFALAGGVALLAAVSLAELATGMPISGGSYHYVNRGLGGLFGSVVGWGMWTGLMFASAFYMVGFGQYIVESVGALDGRPLIVAVGLVGLVLIAGINYYGTEESSGAQNLMIGAEFLVVLAYVGLGALFVDPANLSPFAPTGTGGVLATTGTVFVTFLGFEIIATVAGEIENPGRLIPLSMVLSVVGVTLLYVVVMLVSTGVVPYETLGGSLVPVADVAVVYMGELGVVAIVVAAVIAAISSSNSSVLAASRVLFAMGRDGLMSDRLNVTHDRFGTPHRAIFATGGVTAALIALGLEVESIVALLAEVASFSFLVTYGLVHVALVVFRRADPEAYDPEFRVPSPLYPAVPVLGVASAAGVISQMSTTVQTVGVGVVALGVGWYAAYGRGRGAESGLLGEAFGRGAEPASYEVVVPIVNPDTQRGLLRLAAASARANAADGDAELLAVNVLRVADDSPGRNVEAVRLAHQRDLLGAAEGVADDIGVSLRTRAVTGRDVGETILDVVAEEDPDHVVLGWRGSFADADAAYAFGSNLDPILSAAPADVTLATVGRDADDEVVAFVDDGPEAPTAARRAVEFASLADRAPTLVNVQPPTASDPADRGAAAIDAVAERAGLAPDDYEGAVVVADDVGTAMVERVGPGDLACLGLSSRRTLRDAPAGSLAERLHGASAADVAIARSASGVDDTADRIAPGDGQPSGSTGAERGPPSESPDPEDGGG